MMQREKGWLFVLPWSIDKIGGVNRVIEELAKEYTQGKQYKPFVLTASWDAKTPIIIEKKHYTEIRYRLRRYPSKFDLSFLAFWIFLPSTLFTLIKLYKQFNIRVVNFHFLNTFIFPFALLNYFHKKYRFIISFHGADITNIENSKFKKIIFWPFVFKKVDNIVACSKGLMSIIKQRFDYISDRVTYVHNGISNDFLEINEQPEFSIPDNYILSVGTFESKKGQDILIKAFCNITEKHPELNLVLVGRRTDYLMKLEQLVSELDLVESVFFYEDIPPHVIPVFYKNSAIFISPSRDEPFGIVMLEAGLLKLPVIATRTMGATEIIEHLTDGILVDIDNAEQMTKALIQLLNDESLQTEISEALLKKVTKEFTWSKAASNYYRLAVE